MDIKQDFEKPSEFQAANYHGIEFKQKKDDPLYLCACGIQRCLPSYAFERCAREGYHLHVVLSGKGTLEVKERIHDIHGGQLFLVKHMEETFYQADHENPWCYVWITINGSDAKRYMTYAGFTEDVYVMDCTIDTMEFYSVVKDIIERQHVTLSGEIYRFSQALRYISLAIQSKEMLDEHSRKRSARLSSDYVDYAVKYMTANYAHVRIADVADFLGITRMHFSSVFKKKMLMSPQEFLMQIRMNNSKELLTQTDTAINVIAREVGYEDQFSFSKIFKKKFGLSPEQYRKRHHDEHSV